MKKTDDNDVVVVKSLNFSYDLNEKRTLSDINFAIKKNEFIAIIGHNGSGKSTLSKLISGILKPTSGQILINNTEVNEKNLNVIRKYIGIIFQNPDNQFIGTSVYDDIEFGLQNYQFPSDKMDGIIRQSAKMVGVEKLLDYEPSNLSGGQKQKVAIATIFALKPDIVIFDESTSMLDPLGKIEINKLMHDMKNKYKKTVISITHDMDEALNSDRVLVLNKGKVVFFDKPKNIFMKNYKKIQEIGLDLPSTLKISLETKKLTMTVDEKELISQINKQISAKNNSNFIFPNKNKKDKKLEIAISSKDLNYYYLKKLPNERQALKNVTVNIYKNCINAIIGNTGSGKSTFVQHINFLLQGYSGQIDIYVNSNVYTINKKKLRKNERRISKNELRANIGLVFQFPEYQLFNSTVEKEIIFAPLNFGIKKEEALANVKNNLQSVNLDFSFTKANPFELSGGQKRKVALASVISYNPSIIIFDEPTAGLDPSSIKKILDLILKLKDEGRTIIIISHEIDQLLEIADNFILFNDGKIIDTGTGEKILSNKKLIYENNLKFPFIYDFCSKLAINNNSWVNVKSINSLIEDLNVTL